MNEHTGKKKTIHITIDGHIVAAEHRAPLIDVTRRLGLEIPTLCHHEALEPAGACRVCTVELVKEGWSKFVTACNFPVEDGMVFRTASEPVLTFRRMTLEALLARCPSVSEIRGMAAKAGVTASRFPASDDTCILCGLCTRVCATYATSAIAALHRGASKEIGSFAKTPPEDCVGCGGCASVCPTGHIRDERRGGVYGIWQTSHPLAVCGVEKAKCKACGACEEACPFSIPRVVVKREGASHAVIDREACRGCGVCVAACPSGAIAQPRAKRDIPKSARGVLVIACPRSGFGRRGFPEVPEGVTTMELPCAGGATPAMLLGALARGFDGVLVMGRHQETCRLVGAEDQARDVVARVERMAEIAELGKDRVRFVEPQGGPEGPMRAVSDFLETLAPSVVKTPLPADAPTETLADAVDILSRLRAPMEDAALREALLGAWISPEEVGEGDPMVALETALPNRKGAWRRTHTKVTR